MELPEAPRSAPTSAKYLGFDAVVDRRARELAQELARACPDGIDVYFESVGGQVWQAVLPLLQLLRAGASLRAHRFLQRRPTNGSGHAAHHLDNDREA